MFELGLARSWNRGSASAAAYHRDITDSFKRIFAINGSNPDYNIVNKIYENAGNSRQTGLRDHAPLPDGQALLTCRVQR